ncbi:MAG TPA: copper-binding protein [Burkholderiaceae bacterium]|nr:copper-binding protein [Burkholderiaceae bacterium]
MMLKYLRRSLATLLALGPAVAAVAQAAFAEGEVRKVDSAQQKVTLKHGEIKGLDIPAMSMAYRVKDPGQLMHIAAGDRVRFAIEKIDGTYTVTTIQKTN